MLKQIKLKDKTRIVSCCGNCPCEYTNNHWECMCNLGLNKVKRCTIPDGCPLEDAELKPTYRLFPRSTDGYLDNMQYSYSFLKKVAYAAGEDDLEKVERVLISVENYC